MENPITLSVQEVPIELTSERWKDHILLNHPEMERHMGAILDTITYPDEVREQSEGRFIALRRYGDRLLYVVYTEQAEEKGFVVTAYFIGQIPDKFFKLKKVFPKSK